MPDVFPLVVREWAADVVFEVGRAAQVVVLVWVVAYVGPGAGQAWGGLWGGRPAAYKSAPVGGRRDQNDG